jgi:hypothetical protein
MWDTMYFIITYHFIIISSTILVGNFNVRIAEEKDYIFLEDYAFGDDLQGIYINEVCNLDIFGIPRRRTSKDKGKIRYGNFLLDFCKGNNVSSISIFTRGMLFLKCYSKWCMDIRKKS